MAASTALVALSVLLVAAICCPRFVSAVAEASTDAIGGRTPLVRRAAAWSLPPPPPKDVAARVAQSTAQSAGKLSCASTTASKWTDVECKRNCGLVKYFETQSQQEKDKCHKDCARHCTKECVCLLACPRPHKHCEPPYIYEPVDCDGDDVLDHKCFDATQAEVYVQFSRVGSCQTDGYGTPTTQYLPQCMEGPTAKAGYCSVLTAQKMACQEAGVAGPCYWNTTKGACEVIWPRLDIFGKTGTGDENNNVMCAEVEPVKVSNIGACQGVAKQQGKDFMHYHQIGHAGLCAVFSLEECNAPVIGVGDTWAIYSKILLPRLR